MSNFSMNTAAIERRVEDAIGKHRPSTGQRVENALALVGLFIAALYGIAEALSRLGVRLGTAPVEDGFPWVTIVIFLGCVLPKSLGRATTGKIWELLITRLPLGRKVEP